MKGIIKNNKAFTMVELIIVIAIIAILAAILAPQYLKYVEEGKKAHDLYIARSLRDAALVSVVDMSASQKIPADTTIYVVWETDGADTADISGRVYVDTVSSLASAGNSNNQAGLEFELDLTKAIGEVLSGEFHERGAAGEWNSSRPYYFVGTAQSEASKVDDFKFSINTTTGEIIYYMNRLSPKPVDLENDYYVWFDEIGLTP